MPINSLSHFAINVHEEDRAINFYRAVFGWSFIPWGPPGFHMIDTGSPVHGSIQKVQTEPFPTFIGNFECSITVDDVERVCALIVAQGGRIDLAKTTIPEVADIARVRDTEGNTFSVVKYLA